MAIIDRPTLIQVLTELGDRLTRPATLCVVGSATSFLLGQSERQTPVIDVWEPESDYDLGELARACSASGLLFDPAGEIDPDADYLQVLRPGVTMFPPRFAVERLARFGNLSLVMPPAELIVATNLGRGDDSDLADAAWWVRSRGLTRDSIEDAIVTIPQPERREAARENLVLLELLVLRDPTP